MIFVHGHQFINKNGKIYTTGSLNNNLFERYKNIFGDVTVFATEKNYTNKDKKFINDSNLTDNVKFKLMNKTKNPFEIIKNKSNLISAIKNEDYVVIRLPSEYGLMAAKIARKLKKPYLIEVVGCAWDAYWNHSLKGKIVAPFLFVSMKKAVKKSKYTVYVTNHFLQKRYPSKGKQTNCSNVSLTEFNNLILERRINKINSKENHSKILIGTSAAVDVKYKGQQYVIEALGKLKKEGFNQFEYNIVGGGDPSYLKSIAIKYNVLEEVKFLGLLPHKEVFTWLEDIDIYSQPSKQEGLPRALIEAMSRATPSIGAKTAGIPELLEPKYIFSNTKNNVVEIGELLQKFDKETMLEQATRNYNESKKYEKRIIDNRRKVFFEDFVKASK